MGVKACGVLLLWSVAALPARAFEAEEHSWLADFALRLAYAEACAGATGDPSPACVAARALLPCQPAVSEGMAPQAVGEGRGEAPSPGLQFGTFTMAADLFTHTGSLIPDPESCVESPDVTCCPGKLRDFCDGKALDVCDQEVLTSTEQRVKNRQRWREAVQRYMAVHLNRDHFRDRAAETYNQLHHRAATQVRGGRAGLALRTEAVALHFLQDSFAPGHLASARADSSDPTSGSLHDRYNGRGLPFHLAPDAGWCDQLDSLAALLATPPDASCQPPADAGARTAIQLSGTDVEALRKVLGCGTAVGGSSYQARGDGRLFDSRKLDAERRAHRTFLVLASAASIADVLAARSDDSLLGICFQRQSATVLGEPHRRRPASQPAKDEASQEKGPGHWRSTTAYCVSSRKVEDLEDPDADASFTIDAAHLWPPSASLVRGGSLPDADGYCYPDLSGALAGYATRWPNAPSPQRVPLRGLTNFSPWVSVLEFTWSPLQFGPAGATTLVSRVELAWMFRSDVPETEIVRRGAADAPDRVTPWPFARVRKGRTTTPPLSWSAALHREEQPDFRSFGLGLQASNISKWGPEGAVERYFMAEVGLAQYENAVRDTARWRGGFRAGAGMSLVFFEVGAEHGYELDSRGVGGHEWRYFAGTRIRLSTSWFWTVPRRLRS